MRPHFLQPIVGEKKPASCVLRNRRTGQLLADAIEPAFDSVSRRRGLLGRDGMPEGSALIIAPCQAIHTFRMRFAIDIVFVNRHGLILKVRRGVKPGRLTGSLAAFAVIELPAGAIDRSETRVGDSLDLL
jgi:uncharacterized membrane protein (UPF0127 family)